MESGEPTRLTVNGQTTEFVPRPGESLLEALRERCGVTSVKDGCSPQGQCGCCLALVGERAVVTCAMPVAKASGQEILTFEGVSEADRRLTADAFVAAHLADFPEPLEVAVRPLPDMGVEVGFSLAF